MASAAAAAELLAGDRMQLDTRVCELLVGRLVALVTDDLAGCQRDDVIAVVPLVTLGLELITTGGHDFQVGDPKLITHLVEERPL